MTHRQYQPAMRTAPMGAPCEVRSFTSRMKTTRVVDVDPDAAQRLIATARSIERRKARTMRTTRFHVDVLRTDGTRNAHIIVADSLYQAMMTVRRHEEEKGYAIDSMRGRHADSDATATEIILWDDPDLDHG